MDKTQILKDKIQDSDYVLIGIGEEFNEKFADIEKYPELVKALDEIDENGSIDWLVPFIEKIYLDKQSDSKLLQAYRNLYELVKDKNYFIVTTCIDGNIEKAGFDKEKIVEPCGNYNFLQCSKGCSKELYESSSYMQNISKAIEQGELQSIEKPLCPACGMALTFNNILSENYIEEGYLPKWEKYTKWLQFTLNRKLCILELGVGMNLPNVIRWPFEKVGFYNQKASFFRINETLFQMTEDLGDKGISIEGNAVEFLFKGVEGNK